MIREEGGGGAGLPEMDFQLLAETPPPLEAVYITEGNRIMVAPGLPMFVAMLLMLMYQKR